jgi:hypothetical protein
MNKLLLILLCIPMIGFGQNKYNVALIKKVILDDLELTFSNIEFSKRAISNRCGSTYQYRGPAERGNTFLVADLNIKSKIKNPLLPCMYIYLIDDNNNLELVSHGAVQYSFYKWDDTSTFNGLEHDYNNDFRYTEEINFSIASLLLGNYHDGYGIPKDLNKVNLVLLMHKNDSKVYKKKYEGEAPPYRYLTSDCGIKYNLTLEEAKKEFYFIEILSPSEHSVGFYNEYLE